MKTELFNMEAKLRKDEDDDELHCRVLKQLLNSKITTFHYPPGLDLVSRSAASALWQSLIEERPPDLRTIVCRCCGENGNCNVRPVFDSMLTAFTGLEVLKLECFIASNADLCSIAVRLPKLR
jgi:hypothetical protein